MNCVLLKITCGAPLLGWTQLVWSSTAHFGNQGRAQGLQPQGVWREIWRVKVSGPGWAQGRRNKLQEDPSPQEHWEQDTPWRRLGMTRSCRMKKLLQTQQRFEEEAARGCGRSGESWHPNTVPELGPERKCGLSMSADVDSSQGGLLWCGGELSHNLQLWQLLLRKETH